MSRKPRLLVDHRHPLRGEVDRLLEAQYLRTREYVLLRTARLDGLVPDDTADAVMLRWVERVYSRLPRFKAGRGSLWNWMVSELKYATLDVLYKQPTQSRDLWEQGIRQGLEEEGEP